MTSPMKGMFGMLVAVAAVTFASCDGDEPTTDVETSQRCIQRTPPAPAAAPVFDCAKDRCAECGHSEAPACCFEGCDVIDCSVVRACGECGDADALPCCNPFENGCVIKHAANAGATAATTPVKAAKAAPANATPTTAPPAPETTTTAPTTPATTPSECTAR